MYECCTRALWMRVVSKDEIFMWKRKVNQQMIDEKDLLLEKTIYLCINPLYMDTM